MRVSDYDVIVAGAGSAGCVVAAHLARDLSRRVALVDGGPDFGARRRGSWPSALLRGPGICWDYFRPGTDARVDATPWVVGGGSAVNGCWALWGAPADYDEWSDVSAGAWSWARIAESKAAVEQALHVQSVLPATADAWQRAVLESSPPFAIPIVKDINTSHPVECAGLVRVNAEHGQRWSSAFAFLDPVRDHRNLTVLPRTLIDRVELRNGQVTGLRVLGDGGPARLSAPLVILTAGAFNTPAVLLRSGIGPAQDLSALGVGVTVDLPAVGRHLIDHPGICLCFRAKVPRDGHAEPAPASVLVKVRSGVDDGAWDLHLVPTAGRDPLDGSGEGEVRVWVFVMKPRSRGSVTLRSPDPAEPPLVHQRLLSDPDGTDRAVLAAGARRVRELVRGSPVNQLAGEEVGASIENGRSWIDHTVKTYWHPVGTCRMGPPGDGVVDAMGRVHGVDGLHLADASVMPSIPRANTNLSVIALARGLAADLGAGIDAM